MWGPKITLKQGAFLPLPYDRQMIGGGFFMLLITGKKLHAFKWVELPINDEIIEQVDSLAQAEKQPILSNGNVLIE